MFLLPSHGVYFMVFNHVLGEELDTTLGHPLI